MIRFFICNFAILTMAFMSLYGYGEYETHYGVEWHYFTVNNEYAWVGVNETRAIDQNTQGEISVPTRLGGLTVRKIGVNAFESCTNLTFVCVGEGVDEIKHDAFDHCTNLKEIWLPSSLRCLGSSVFYECESLESIKIPKGVEIINGGLFYGCGALEQISLPSTLTVLFRNKLNSTKAWGRYSKCAVAVIDGYGIDVDEKSESVVVSAACKALAYNLFDESHGLKDVVFLGDVPKLLSSSGYLFSEACKTAVVYVPNDVSSWNSYVESGEWQGRKVVPVPLSDDGVLAVYDKDDAGMRLISYGAAVGDSGSFITNQFGRTITLPSAPQKDCYKFLQWEIEGETYDPGETYDCTSDVVSIFARWEALQFTTVPYEGGVIITGGTSLPTSLRIPASISGESVVGIAKEAFVDEKFVSVEIAEGIQFIGDNAFKNCKELTSVKIPSSMTSIGTDVFLGCSKLQSIDVDSSNLDYSSIGGVLFNKAGTLLLCFPFGRQGSYQVPLCVEKIAPRAFIDCSGLLSVSLQDGVTNIGYCAFSGCSGLSYIAIPASVTIVGDKAFNGCTNVTNATVPGWRCGIDFSSVKSVVISEGTLRIHGSAFADCSELTSVTMPEGILDIGGCAFSRCDGIVDMIIPQSVTNIGGSAFQDCNRLSGINLPNGLTSLKSLAFSGCSSLIEITIPKSVKGIESGAFSSCSSLKSVILEPGIGYIESSAFRCCTSLCNINIPASVKTIGYGAFYGCEAMMKVSMAYGVTNIGVSAFEDCCNLVCVEIPSSIEGIGDSAFRYCSKIVDVIVPGWKCGMSFSNVTNLTISEGTTCIKENEFKGCSKLQTVSIPSSVTKIGSSSFYECRGLKVMLLGSGLTEIGDECFAYCTSMTTISIPDDVVSIGKKAFWYCSSLPTVKIPGNVETINDYCFWCCTSLQSVTMSAGVTSIGSSAFGGCRGLTNLTMSSSVTNIGNYAFGGCSALPQVMIPPRVVKVGDKAFWSCSSMTSINIPASLSTIGYSVFAGCSGLSNVEISKGVTSIDQLAFYRCKGLSSLQLPEGVISIGKSAFEECSSLSNVEMPQTMENIGSSAFGWCTNLTSITVPSGVTNLGDVAFFHCDNLNAVDFECAPPTGIADARIKQDAKIRYNVAYQAEWLAAIDQCGWTNATPYDPKYKSSDSLPDIGDNPTVEELANALSECVDETLRNHITNAVNYNCYRAWANKIGTKAVKSSNTAWMSFALGSNKLLERKPKDEDIAVEKFVPAGEAGKFDFIVSLDGVEIGSDAQKENLKKVFGIEGSSTLCADKFSSDNVDLLFDSPADGKVRFVAGPKNIKASVFFMKVKINE